MEISSAGCNCRTSSMKLHSVSHPGHRFLRVRPNQQKRFRSKLDCAAATPEDDGSSPIGGGNVSTEEPPRSDSDRKKKGSQVSSFVRSTATTFAPRSSTAVRNPAFRGSLLYSIFGAQAWISLLVGGLLSFNIVFPTDKPSIARLIGMWSIWMFTIPALRARECNPTEKEALNILFLLVPLINVGLPFVWKSFPFIFTADCLALALVYAWKIGIPTQASPEP